MKVCVIHFRAILQEIFKISTGNMHLKLHIKHWNGKLTFHTDAKYVLILIVYVLQFDWKTDMLFVANFITVEVSVLKVQQTMKKTCSNE